MRNCCLITLKKHRNGHRRYSISFSEKFLNIHWTKVANGKCSVKKVFLVVDRAVKLTCFEWPVKWDGFFLYFFVPETFWLWTYLEELRIINCDCWEMSSQVFHLNLAKLGNFRLLQLERLIFAEHTEMRWWTGLFLKNKYRPMK